MPKQIADLTPAELFESFLVLEHAADAVEQDADSGLARHYGRVTRHIQSLFEGEILSRFDLDSLDNLTSVITAAHMTTDESIKWARDEPGQVIEALRTGTVQQWLTGRRTTWPQ